MLNFVISNILSHPEVFLSAVSILILLIGVLRKDASPVILGWVMSVLLLVTARISYQTIFDAEGNNINYFVPITTVIICVLSSVAIVFAIDWLKAKSFSRFEYCVVVAFTIVGAIVMLSANNLLRLYIGAELMSLSLYILAAYKRRGERSTEAGVKYFSQGAFASAIMLFGISLLYGFSGSIEYSSISNIITDADNVEAGMIVGMLMLVVGFLFKIGAVPFHMWLPDVYEGAALPVTAFFSTAPKFASFAALIKLVVCCFIGAKNILEPVIYACAIASMVVGALGAIRQTNIKRLMAYSSINHIGYALIGVVVGTDASLSASYMYLIVYTIMNIGAFSIILSLRSKDILTEEISDMAGMSKHHPFMAFAMAIFMLSMIGIPPFIGFIGKFYLFKSAIAAGFYYLSVVAVLISVISASYYLRIIKVIYFDAEKECFDRPSKPVDIIMFCSATVSIFFFVFADRIVDVSNAVIKLLAGA